MFNTAVYRKSIKSYNNHIVSDGYILVVLYCHKQSHGYQRHILLTYTKPCTCINKTKPFFNQPRTIVGLADFFLSPPPPGRWILIKR